MRLRSRAGALTWRIWFLLLSLPLTFSSPMASAQRRGDTRTGEYLNTKKTTAKGDKLAGGQVQVDGVTQSAQNGFLHAQVTLKNSSRKDIQMTYRIRWFDKAGVELRKGALLWHALALKRGESQKVEATCPVRYAGSFCLDFREVSKQ